MLENLIELITQYIDIEPDEISEESRFIENIGFNSYDFMCMLGDCEQFFLLPELRDKARELC